MFATAAAIVALATPSAPSPASHAAHKVVRYGNAVYHVVVCNLSSPSLSAKTVHSNQLTNVWKLIGKEQPLIAVTGTFFSPKHQIPVADVLVNGKLVAHGARGSGLGVAWTGELSIFDEKFHRPTDWSSFQFGLRGAVRVVNGGKVVPNPRGQSFKDPAIWGRAARVGVGTTKQGKVVFLVTQSKVTLSQLGHAMVKQGVRAGLSLDGGGSTCLYYGGKMLVSPNRKLSNLLVITRRNLVAGN
ncbi:MAG: phosphodiester glycosidase family protein [Methanoregulaceae archaeon]|nr:phosphodiester glycosidase family protein [Methanoregulaceae archaeon]